MSKMRKGIEEEAVNEVTPLKEQQHVQQSWGSKVCGMMKMLVGLTRELISGPATTLNDCLEAFFDTNELTGVCVCVCVYVHACVCVCVHACACMLLLFVLIYR